MRPETHAPRHRWRFFGAGGFDQVVIDRPEDLLSLDTLDQKLWTALSCPLQGVYFDPRTLALVDADGDGHLRAPELLAAIRWTAGRLRRPAALLEGGPLSLADLDDTDEEGTRLMATARRVLAAAGRPEALTLTVADVTEAGQALDRAPWRHEGPEWPLGPETSAAWEALLAVRDKVDDFFTRSRMVAFDARAEPLLNGREETLVALADRTLAPGDPTLAALPLAHVDARARLPLVNGLNPAWAAGIAALRDRVVSPLLGPRDDLGLEDWTALRETFAPHEAWLAGRAKLAGDLAELERLVHYVRDLEPLANNFVAFRDFYTRRGPAIFQAGTLYLDGRSCELCLKVLDTARHATLASLAGIFLAYCDCVRRDEKMTIVAAFTAGDADRLMVGRNGVFYDRQGRDWDATIVRLVEHPISLRQAFFSPYKRAARLLAEQVQKWAAAREQAAPLPALVPPPSPPGAPPGAAATPPGRAPFDLARYAGIFAAVGLAIGALGTAVASLVTGFFGLSPWQMPLALVGLLLVVSGPSVILAWFKLKNRNLGPLLDANGWSVNGRARIDLPFGRMLTQVARLPAGSVRARGEPWPGRRSWRRRFVAQR